MTLTKEQEALLNGEKGEVMAKIMKTLVMFGDTFGAERLVPVTGKYGHTVISYGLKVLGPVLDVFDEIIDAAGFADHFLCKSLQDRLVGNITDAVTAGRLVDHIDLGALPAEFIRDAFADSVCAARDDGDLVCKFVHRITPPFPDIVSKVVLFSYNNLLQVMTQ